MGFSMEIALVVGYVGFSVAFLTWVLMDMLKRWRYGSDRGLEDRFSSKNSTISRRVVLFSCSMITVLYVGFGIYESWSHGIVVVGGSVLRGVTWILATGVAFYVDGEAKKWPLVLVLWWVYSTLFCIFLVCVYLAARFASILVEVGLPRAKFVDILACPLSLLVWIAALGRFRTRKHHELEDPLLETEKENLRGVDGFDNAGVWSQLMLSWLNPLFEAGKARKLEISDVPSVPRCETAESASFSLEESLLEQNCNDIALSKAIFLFVRKALAVNAIFAGTNTIASYMGPLLITRFVDYLLTKDENTGYQDGIIIAVMFFFAKSVESLSQRQWNFGANRIGVRIRAAVIALVYKKSLSVKFAGPGQGKITNFVNVDAERIGDFCSYVHGIWLLPVQVLLAFIILYMNLGAAPSSAAIFTTFLVMVSITPLASRQKRLHSEIMEAKDVRIKATSETLKNMRVLKLHSWDSTFLKKVLNLREVETSWLSKYLYTCSAIAFLFWASPTLVSVVTFGVCILVKTPLTSGTVLSALATFRILQEPIYNLPELISMISQTKVSLDRLDQYIGDEDQEKQAPRKKQGAASVVVDIKAAEYAWEGDNASLNKPTISISTEIQIKKGDKVAICGSVGSGKSSLLCSILGEIPRISGMEAEVLGTKAYVPQSPWIQTGTVRENILFGHKMKFDFYKDVIAGCALNKDIDMWADGDQSVVGERGINLSGGQKQRIQLARAIYSDADVYFLDDPFSAVDGHTGAHMFKKCLMQLLSKKTVIYLTHQLEFLDAADLILVMKDGKIAQMGKYEDLINDLENELARQMVAHRKTFNNVNSHQELDCTVQTSHVDNQAEGTEESAGSSISRYTLSDKTQEEEAETGRVNWRVYSTFITAAYGGALVPVILLCQILYQGLQMGGTYW
ncbi:hypothetical protein Drorol1_Dr00008073, partial [Drosera rotundifolia]